MTDLGDFAARGLILDVRDLGQDRVTHGVECLRNQRRTDDAARVVGAERDGSATPTPRQRSWEKIAHEVDDVLEIVSETNALECVAADLFAVRFAQANRPADAGLTMQILR